jgi:DNA repair protein RadC
MCARFGSLRDLLSADAAQLSTVPGIGPSRATMLEQLLRATMPVSQNGSS